MDQQNDTIFILLSFEVLILEMMILMLQVGTFCSRSATTPTLSLNSPVRGSEAQVGFLLFFGCKCLFCKWVNSFLCESAGLWQNVYGCKLNQRDGVGLNSDTLTHLRQISVSLKPSYILKQNNTENFPHKKSDSAVLFQR